MEWRFPRWCERRRHQPVLEAAELADGARCEELVLKWHARGARCLTGCRPGDGLSGVLHGWFVMYWQWRHFWRRYQWRLDNSWRNLGGGSHVGGDDRASQRAGSQAG